MVSRSKGLRNTTRRKFTKPHREKGKSPITRALQVFEMGEKADIVIDSSIHNGQPHHRFHGYCGKVVGTQGRAYKLSVLDGNLEKVLIVNPEHMRKAPKSN